MNGIKPSNYTGDYTVTTVPAPKSDICPQCGKPVKRGVLVVASVLEIRLGVGKNELYHAKCYEERSASHETV